MVKGVSRQVIVLKSPDPKLFEQAIFILRADAHAAEITDEMLLKEAGRVANGKRNFLQLGPVWACGGAMVTGIIWLLTAIF